VRPSHAAPAAGHSQAEEIRFQYRRKGKRLRSHHAALVDERLPQLAIDLTPARIEPAALFAAPVQEVRLEIGFGGAEHLLDEAARHPGIGFLGCDPFMNSVAKALAGIEARQLANVRLHPGDARQLIGRLAPQSLARVYLFYPDPWPKRRHRRRRLISDKLLRSLAGVMRPLGELRFATDIDDYSAWTLARVLRSPDFDWQPSGAAGWTQPWPGWTASRYEEKAKLAGRPSAYFTFIRRP
jgi:tRNA (guanine-N7-)-methyltransferase